jgi:beta-phosphoglucomutase-like phosphatase (HAD superfamily)
VPSVTAGGATRRPPARIAAVILDMDGLMIDTEAPVRRCCQQAAAAMGFTLDLEFYERAIVGHSWPDSDAALVAHFGPTFPLEDFKARFRGVWGDYIALHGIAPKPGLFRFLTMLETLNLKTAVATSTHQAEADAHLQAIGIRERFSVVVTGDQIEKGKPAPDIYLEAARRLNVPPHSCVALEDSNAGVVAATSAGMTTLLIPDGDRQPSADARNRAFSVLPSLEEAEALVSSWLATDTRSSSD